MVSQLALPGFLRGVRAHTGVNECPQYLKPGIHHQGYVLTAKMAGQTRRMSVGDALSHIVLIKLCGGGGGEWSKSMMALPHALPGSYTQGGVLNAMVRLDWRRWGVWNCLGPCCAQKA